MMVKPLRHFLKMTIKSKATYDQAKNKNLMTLEEFKEKNHGQRGTKEREQLEDEPPDF
jgi:hypothetical protein